MSETKRIGTQGWEEFISSKKELLGVYEAAKEQVKNLPVKVEHGNVAEEAYREWLGNFLPKRFGVTSGYIISAGYSNKTKLRHFDVIIYDQANAPVLWHSNNPGKSSTGKERAIPVEYVLHIAEVKASLTKTSAKDATQKLEELLPLLSKRPGSDDLSRSTYLPEAFTCSVVFFEVSEEVEEKHGDLTDLIKPYIRGYIGGIIFKSPDGDVSKTAQIMPTISKTKKDSYGPQSFDKDPTLLYGGSWVWSELIFKNYYHGVHWDWQENHFTDFTHNLISRLKGVYDKSSFTWYGRSRPLLDSDKSGGDSLWPLDALDQESRESRKSKK